jgi:hypothetical protein
LDKVETEKAASKSLSVICSMFQAVYISLWITVTLVLKLGRFGQ